ncbi:MAG: TauD/TfdA family dioxygenase [Gammaproteobacteria bacterium]|nr:TauD/TfdA family dioxygenase [Gammaproteobacteria bacterium]
MRIEALNGNFGKVVSDIDIPTIDDEQIHELLTSLYANRFLVLKTSGLSKDEYRNFARRIGDPIQLSRDTDFPEIAHISNLETSTTESRLGAAHWHTDQSFKKTVSSVTMLYSSQAPAIGGETKFCDMAAAYSALAESTKIEIEDLVVEHRHGISVSAPKGDHRPLPPAGWDSSYTVFHPLVRRHPETDQKTLYAVTGTAQGIRGMPQSEANALLKSLCSHVLQPQFKTSYHHQRHDIVMWDNPTVMHSATPIHQATGPSDTRLLWRISLRGSPPLLRVRRHTETQAA